MSARALIAITRKRVDPSYCIHEIPGKALSNTLTLKFSGFEASQIRLIESAGYKIGKTIGRRPHRPDVCKDMSVR